MSASKQIPAELCERIHEVDRRLLVHYGTPLLHPNGDPMGELVLTILSQHTSDVSSGKAFEHLKRRYPEWNEVSSASAEDLAETIRFAGLPMQKARTIQTALATIDADSLSSLSTLSVPEARAKLTSIRGVGDKTASCVLLFALGMPAQPVDTHIERVSKRIGINNGEPTASGIQHVYERCLPQSGDSMYAFHVDMVQHGRKICQSRAPKCEMCVLTDLCDYYGRHLEVI